MTPRTPRTPWNLRRFPALCPRRFRSPGSGHDGGFTLMELILAVALASMLLGEAAGLLWLGQRAYVRTRDAAERDAQADTALALLEQDLAHVMPQVGQLLPSLLLTQRVQGQEAPLLRLRVGALPGRQDQVVDYFLAPDLQGNLSLARRSQAIAYPDPRTGLADSDVPPQWELLLAEVERFELRCLGPGDWRPQWNSLRDAGMPRLLEVSLMVKADAGSAIYRRVLELSPGPLLNAPLATEQQP